jgi:ankyrin repeat protein
MGRLEAQFGTDAPPAREAITHALWSASSAGQRETARYLLEQGADLKWVGWDDRTPLDVAVQAGHQLAVPSCQRIALRACAGRRRSSTPPGWST